LRPVIAQFSRDPSANRVCVLLYTNDSFGDFTFSARVKLVSGDVEPAAGLIFRAQDKNSYYVLRISAKGNLLWYKVIGGIGYENLGIGVLTPAHTNEWHELSVHCAGSGIRCFLDGKLALPPPKPGAPTDELTINDTSFSTGEIGLWSKADTVPYFTDIHLAYSPRVPLIQTIADETAQRYPRLLGLKLFGNKEHAAMPVIIADPIGHALGTSGTKTERDVLDHGTSYFLKATSQIEVTLPLRDRNGDIIAAMRTTMRAFKGETRDTALSRATIIKKDLEARMATLQDISR